MQGQDQSGHDAEGLTLHFLFTSGNITKYKNAMENYMHNNDPWAVLNEQRQQQMNWNMQDTWDAHHDEQDERRAE